jgi:hypothetical protein
MAKFYCVSISVNDKDCRTDTLPFSVQATNYDEAVGKAMRVALECTRQIKNRFIKLVVIDPLTVSTLNPDLPMEFKTTLDSSSIQRA